MTESKPEAPLALDYFSGGVPPGLYLQMTLDELSNSIDRKATGIIKINEICLIGLVAYAEAFFKDQFAAILNIEPTLITRLKKSGHDTSIDPATLLLHADNWQCKLGFILAEKHDFGTSKKINSMYTALLQISPFSKNEARYFDALLRYRNLLVHHGGVFTSSYISQIAAESFEFGRGAYFDSLVVCAQYFDERLRFIRNISRKTMEVTWKALSEFAAGASPEYSSERRKAVEALNWHDAD